MSRPRKPSTTDLESAKPSADTLSAQPSTSNGQSSNDDLILKQSNNPLVAPTTTQVSADTEIIEMPFTAHLIELRTRLIHIIWCLVILFVPLMYYSNKLYALLSAPLQRQLPAGASMIATNMTSSFMALLKLSLSTALIIGMPYILYQIWLFVAPALYKSEKRIAMPMLLSSVVLFYAGIAFAYFITLPATLKFFIEIAPSQVMTMPDISSYFSFCLKLFLAFGVTFEIPVAVLLLILSGVVSVASLKSKRRYIIVGCFFVSMFITPPDAMSMAMLAIPMWLLFELGLLFGQVLERKNAIKATK